jgi:hypothetical protein
MATLMIRGFCQNLCELLADLPQALFRNLKMESGDQKTGITS